VLPVLHHVSLRGSDHDRTAQDALELAEERARLHTSAAAEVRNAAGLAANSSAILRLQQVAASQDLESNTWTARRIEALAAKQECAEARATRLEGQAVQERGNLSPLLERIALVQLEISALAQLEVRGSLGWPDLPLQASGSALALLTG